MQSSWNLLNLIYDNECFARNNLGVGHRFYRLNNTFGIIVFKQFGSQRLLIAVDICYIVIMHFSKML